MITHKEKNKEVKKETAVSTENKPNTPQASPKSHSQDSAHNTHEKAGEKKIEKLEEKKTEKKIVKKDKAIINGKNLPVSTKHIKFICRFIKNNRIEEAIEKMEKVIRREIFVPMTGEYPHRKGKTGKTGRYPEKACREMIGLLKSLKANANVNSIENAVIKTAIANMASRPHKRHGSGRAKRTHVYLEAREKIIKENREVKTAEISKKK